MVQTTTTKSRIKKRELDLPQEPELTITRIFDAPRERIWQEWSDPDRIKNWWGPKDFTAPFVEIDFRVGGINLSCMRGPDGKDTWSIGVYREIIPLEKIVVTDNFADDHGKVVPPSYYGMPGDKPFDAVIIVTFEDQDGKTKLTLRHLGLPPDTIKDAEAGWSTSLDKLAANLK